MVNFNITARTMTAEKTISMSFRVSPKFKALLEIASGSENRSLTNRLQTLVFARRKQQALSLPPDKVSSDKGARK